MLKRTISKNPELPEISPKGIKLLANLCFRPDDKLEPVDLIFIFGGAEPDYVKQLVELVPELVKQKISKKIVVTGGRPSFEDRKKTSHSEAHMLIDKFEKAIGDTEVEFIKENDSRNIMENVKNAVDVIDQPEIKSLLFITKSHVSRRAHLTLTKYVPQVKILQKTVDVVYQIADKKLSKNNWNKFAFGRNRVWGEYLRIKRYGQGEMIEYNEVEDLVKEIEENVK